jgi:hypothetical protein
MQPIFKSNMEYRHYLMNNSDNIIKYNQLQAKASCSNTLMPFENSYVQSSPVIFNSVTDQPLSYDSNSDLKLNHLNKLLFVANMSAPSIQYN